MNDDAASIPAPNARGWLALSLVPQLGAVRIAQLNEAQPPWPEGWRQMMSVSQRHYFDYLRQPQGDQHVLAPMLRWCKEGHDRVLLHPGHAMWPALLSHLPDPPPVLWAQGDLTCLGMPALAIVGTRHPTPKGVHYARIFARAVAETGGTVVSGMALGIDAAAHEGALDVQGRTVAVLGCGLSHSYPRQHAALQARILTAGGLLLSEHPPDTKARPAFFPRRNRIITGMSLGVLVVEAMVRSGSLVSARLALEQNREVFALPGPPDATTSLGCHQLIRQGAVLVTTPDELMAELRGVWSREQYSLSSAPRHWAALGSTAGRGPAETGVAAEASGAEEINVPWLALLQDGPLSVDQLVLHSGESVSSVMNAMLMLELSGRAVFQGDGWALLR